MDSSLPMSIMTGMFSLRLGDTFSCFVVSRNSTHLVIADDERLLRVVLSRSRQAEIDPEWPVATVRCRLRTKSVDTSHSAQKTKG